MNGKQQEKAAGEIAAELGLLKSYITPVRQLALLKSAGYCRAILN